MKKMERLTRIEHAGVVAVVREDSQKRAIEAARAVIKGGIKGLKLLFLYRKQIK